MRSRTVSRNVFCATAATRDYTLKVDADGGAPVTNWASGGYQVAPARASGNATLAISGLPGLGVRIPENPFLLELVKEAGCPITATSANVSGRPGCRRIRDLDPDEELTDLSGPLTLTAYGQWTKKAGFFRLQAPGSANATLRELVWEDASFGRPTKADSAEVVLFTRQDF